MTLAAVEIRPTPNFSMILTDLYQVRIKQINGLPLFYRNYTAAGLQQFSAYLNLGVSFADALP